MWIALSIIVAALIVREGLQRVANVQAVASDLVIKEIRNIREDAADNFLAIHAIARDAEKSREIVMDHFAEGELRAQLSQKSLL